LLKSLAAAAIARKKICFIVWGMYQIFWYSATGCAFLVAANDDFLSCSPGFQKFWKTLFLAKFGESKPFGT